MKKISMYEASGRRGCLTERNFPYKMTDGKTYNYEKAVALNKVMEDARDGKVKDDELEAAVSEAFDSVDSMSSVQKTIDTGDVTARIRRFNNSDKRDLQKAPSKEIQVSDDLTVIVSPNYTYTDKTPVVEEGETVYDGVIEVIKLKNKLNKMKGEDIENDLGLKAMLLYGADLVPKGKKYIVKASYYFLRREDDRYGETPHFEEDFYAPDGNNIITIRDDAVGGKGLSVGMMEKIHDMADEYIKGKEAEECTEKDCEYCPMNNICHYSEPPVQLVREKKATMLSAIKLTPSQEEAINFRDGIAVINAGAGSGKTTVVALRVANMIAEGVDPKKIICITFTNNAAEEMRKRIKDYLEDFGMEDIDISGMRIITFNAFGNDVIKEEFARFLYPRIPKVIDDIEKSRICKDLINRVEIKGLDYRNFQSKTKYVRGALPMTKMVFDIMKSKRLSSYEYEQVREELDYCKRFATLDAVKQLAELYDEFEEILRTEALIEFSDQEVKLMEIIMDDPYYLDKYEFEHIIVDEFQDSNENQIKFLQQLTDCPTFKSLMVVGDDNQAIYSFRGTTPEYLINFHKYFKGRAITYINLSENQRSTKNIIEFANKIASINVYRVIKSLIPTRETGKPVVVRGFLDRKEENKYIVEGIKAKIDAGVEPEDIAFIAPNNDRLIEMAGLLREAGIPAVMMNPEPFMKNSRVIAAVSYFKFFDNEENTKAAVEFINASIGGGVTFLSEKEISDRIIALAEQNAEIKELPEEDRMKEIEKVLRSIDFNDDEIYQAFLDGLMLKPYHSIIRYVYDFEEFGKEAARRREHSYPGVVCITAHSSKGLEYPICFNSITGYDSEELHTGRRQQMIEEKRRLLFVSSTRARDELYVTGVYTCGGSEKRGYVYNQFLQNCYEAENMIFDPNTIEKQREMLKAERKAAKEAEKAKEMSDDATKDAPKVKKPSLRKKHLKEE